MNDRFWVRDGLVLAAFFSKEGIAMQMKQLSQKEHADVTTHAAAIDNIFGLPPGTILKIITQLLPILISIFGGGTPPATKP